MFALRTLFSGVTLGAFDVHSLRIAQSAVVRPAQISVSRDGRRKGRAVLTDDTIFALRSLFAGIAFLALQVSKCKVECSGALRAAHRHINSRCTYVGIYRCRSAGDRSIGAGSAVCAFFARFALWALCAVSACGTLRAGRACCAGVALVSLFALRAPDVYRRRIGKSTIVAPAQVTIRVHAGGEGRTLRALQLTLADPAQLRVVHVDGIRSAGSDIVHVTLFRVFHRSLQRGESSVSTLNVQSLAGLAGVSLFALGTLGACISLVAFLALRACLALDTLRACGALGACRACIALVSLGACRAGLSGQSLHALRTLFALRSGVSLGACWAGQFFQLFLGEHVVGKRRAGGSCFALRASLTLRACQRFQLLRCEILVGKGVTFFAGVSLIAFGSLGTCQRFQLLRCEVAIGKCSAFFTLRAGITFFALLTLWSGHAQRLLVKPFCSVPDIQQRPCAFAHQIGLADIAHGVCQRRQLFFCQHLVRDLKARSDLAVIAFQAGDPFCFRSLESQLHRDLIGRQIIPHLFGLSAAGIDGPAHKPDVCQIAVVVDGFQIVGPLRFALSQSDPPKQVIFIQFAERRRHDQFCVRFCL